MKSLSGVGTISTMEPSQSRRQTKIIYALDIETDIDNDVDFELRTILMLTRDDLSLAVTTAVPTC